MNRTTSSTWLLSGALLVIGFAFVDRPLQDRLAQAELARDRIVAETDRNDALRRDTTALRRQLAALGEGMKAVDLSDDPARIVATFVGEATAVASVCNVRITGFDGRPLARSANLPRSKAAPERSVLSATTIELTIEGHYNDLVASLRRMSHVRVPVRIEIASIERTVDPRHRAEPLLDARIRVDILHRATAKVADAAAL